MPHRPARITVERVNLPDEALAVGAILPLFLGFLEGRAAPKAPPGSSPSTVPARALEENRDLPA